MNLLNAVYKRTNEITMRQLMCVVIPFSVFALLFYLSVPFIPNSLAVWGTSILEHFKTIGYVIFAFRLLEMYKRHKVFAFKLFFFAVVAWLPGQIIQSITPITANTPYIYSNSADYFLIIAIVIVVWGVLAIGLYGLSRREKTQIMVHAVTFGSCVAFLATIYVTKVWLSNEASLIRSYLPDYFSLSLDLILISVCLSLALYRKKDLFVAYMCTGLFFQVAADLLYLSSTFQGLDSTRPVQRMLIWTALMFWVSSSFIADPVPRHKGNLRSEVTLASGSYVAVGSVLIFAFFQARSLETVADVIVYSFLFTYLAIVVAQVIGFADNKRLVADQQRSIFEISQSEEKYQQLAVHDTLTSLHNRTYFIAALKESLAVLENKENNLAVFFVDLDRFKEINDSFGHIIGDNVIREIAIRIKSVVGEEGLVCRLGGDEFAVLLTDEVDRNKSLQLAKKILAIATKPIDVAGTESYLSCSIGIAFSSETNSESETILRNADAAMYRAKELGRNRIEFSEDVVKPVLEMNGWTLSDLHHAIEDDQIDVHYQPVFELSTNRVIAVEALARWRHEDRGMISPAEFIAVAEDNGLIIELGNKVISKSLKQLQHFSRLGISVNINLSFRQLNDPELIRFLSESCSTYKVDPTFVNFELTESALLGDVRNAISGLKEIRRNGFNILIDDFGTGYSSLSYLKKFPISGFKIDKAYVQGFGANDDDKAIVVALVGLANSMGLLVTAEGVNSETTRSSLAELGCDYGQGYFFSKPLPFDEIWMKLNEKNSDEESSLRTA